MYMNKKNPLPSRYFPQKYYIKLLSPYKNNCITITMAQLQTLGSLQTPGAQLQTLGVPPPPSTHLEWNIGNISPWIP